MAKPPKLVSKAEYASMRGINRSQVTRYCQKGMPSPGGMIDPEQADWWREQNLDQTKPKSKISGKQQRVAATTPPAPKVNALSPPTAAAVPATGDASGVIVRFPDGQEFDLAQLGDLNTVTRIDKFWAGELKRREAMVHDREHLPRAEVEAASSAAILLFKSGLMGVSRRIAGQIEGKGLAEREQVIRDEIRSALEILSTRLEEIASGEGPMNDPASDDDQGGDEGE